MLMGHSGSTFHRILHDGEEGGIVSTYLLHALHEVVVFLYVALQLSTELRLRELRTGRQRVAPTVFLLVHLRLRPSHELRAPHAAELIEFLHYRRGLECSRHTQLLLEPALQMVVELCGTHAIDVPRHIHEERQVVGRHLRIVNIHYPYILAVVVVGGLHLRVYQARLRRSEPQVVVRTAPVAQVIVYTTAARTLLLGLVAHASHISVVVVAPHQRNIVRHNESRLIDVEYLLIRNEHLRHARNVFVVVFLYQTSLTVYGRLQAVELLLLRLAALHSAVVDAAHADGEEHILTLYLLEALYPVFLHVIPVGDEVIRAASVLVPFRNIVPQKGFTMRRTHHDVERVGQLPVTRNGKERLRALMHARPERVGPEAKHQLEDPAVGLGTYGALGRLRFYGLMCPYACGPVLVVDEDAAILNRWALKLVEVAHHVELLLTLRCHVAPPYPGRHTCLTRQLQDAVGRTATVITYYIYMSAIDRHEI